MNARKFIEDASDGTAPRSMKNDKSSVFSGEPVELDGVSSRLLIFKRTRGGKTYYDFVENVPDAGATPQVYTYCLETGNITRGSGSLWARQELRSRSYAFHGGNPDKVAIPKNLALAASVISKHYDNYAPKDDKFGGCFDR